MFLTQIETNNIDEAMDIGDHAFTVDKVPLTFQGGGQVPDKMAVINLSNNQYLGTVGKEWKPVQPRVLYDMANDLLAATDGKISGVINMHGGSVMGIMFKLAQREYIAGDPVDINFLMMTAFNGMYGIAGHALTNRLSCLNQCNTSNKVFNLKHTKFVENRLVVVKDMLKYYRNEIANFDDKMNKMINYRITDEQAVEWFKSLLPEPKSPRSTVMVDNQVVDFVECLQSGRGSRIRGVRNTKYGAWQALTEYVNHHRTVRIHNDREVDEVRFQTIHFGTGNTLMQKGLNNLALDFEFGEDEFAID